MDPFVYPLVAATDEQQAVKTRKLPCQALAKSPAFGSEQDDGHILLVLAKHVFHGSKDRFGFHDHAPAPPIGSIISDAVAAGSIVADIVQIDGYQACIQGSLDDAFVEHT